MYEIFGYTFSTGQLIALALVAFFAGFTKTGIIGLGLLITPVMAHLFSAGQALGFMIPLYLVGDVVAMARYRHKILWRPLLKALPWGVAGVLAGWLIAGSIGRFFGENADRYLRSLMGLLLACVVLLNIYVTRHPELAMSRPASVRNPDRAPGVRTWYAAMLGSFGGLVSMLTNSGGPIWALYYSSLGIEVREVIGTSVWCFFTISLIKVPFSASLGFLDLNTVKFNLILAPLTVAGVFAGSLLSGKFSKKAFGAMLRVLGIIGAGYMILF